MNFAQVLILRLHIVAKANQRLQPAPELASALQSAFRRLEKYIAFCDAEIESLIQDSTLSGLVKARQFQVLTRTLQSLQKDWVKHMSALYPNIPITSPSESRTLTQKDLDTASEDELRTLIHHLSQDDEDQDEDAYH